MRSGTVRISEAARKTLRGLAAEVGKPMQAVLDEAIEVYRRRRFLEKANTAFEKLRSDSSAEKAEIKEREEWDATLADGLEDE